jgi:hypothetical protein
MIPIVFVLILTFTKISLISKGLILSRASLKEHVLITLVKWWLVIKPIVMFLYLLVVYLSVASTVTGAMLYILFIYFDL